jgi:CRP-like cAMP-binding protein
LEKKGIEGVPGQQPFLRGMTAGQLAALAECSFEARFEEGRFLFHEGQDADNFYLLREGRVSIELHAPERGVVSIQILEAGDLLGWSWIVPPFRWRFDARAMGPVLALGIDGRRLREKCDADRELGYELMKRLIAVVTRRLESTRFQLLESRGLQK